MLLTPQAPPAQNTWCMRQLVYIENCIGKSPIVKNSCVNNYLNWIKFSYLKCVTNLSLVPFLKPFWSRLVKLFETITPPSKRMERQTTPSFTGQMSFHKIIAFSSKGKVPNRNKINSSIKLNKFHTKTVCFGGRKTREEQKLCPKICLFGFPEVLVMGSATTAVRKAVSSSTLSCGVTSDQRWMEWSAFPFF